MTTGFSLVVDELVRDYGGGVQIGPLSFNVSEGEFLSVLGPSGCGKSTLLRCTAGFEPTDRGRILLDGVDVGRLAAHQRRVGLVFQSYALFPHLSVGDNVAFGLKLQRVPKAERRERVEDALRVVSLSGYEGRYPSQLSGGQQQRVAIARSLVLRPAIMLFDEPLSNLDYKLRLQMRDELRSLQRRLGMTFVFVTHDQTEALAVSDRIIVMSHGRIEQDGTARDIYRRPRTRFVADFIGGANLIPVAAVGPAANGRAEVTLGDGRRTEALVADGATPDPSWIAIRPESLSIAEPGSPAILRGRIGESVFAGDRMQLTVHLESVNGEAHHVSLYVAPDLELPEVVDLAVAPDGAVLVGERP